MTSQRNSSPVAVKSGLWEWRGRYLFFILFVVVLLLRITLPWSWARTMADVLCDDEPVAVTTALREHPSFSRFVMGMILTASGRDEDLSNRNRIFCNFKPGHDYWSYPAASRRISVQLPSILAIEHKTTWSKQQVGSSPSQWKDGSGSLTVKYYCLFITNLLYLAYERKTINKILPHKSCSATITKLAISREPNLLKSHIADAENIFKSGNLSYWPKCSI